jgi:hypothetical protein
MDKKIFNFSKLYVSRLVLGLEQLLPQSALNMDTIDLVLSLLVLFQQG